MISKSPLIRDFAFATDLYELTMAAAYFDNKETANATFELFVRTYPRDRSYLVAAGLEQALEYITQVRFDEDQIAFLRAHPSFQNVSTEFFEYLRNFRFAGDVWALPEGTVFFTDEPMLRVTAPIVEAQILETYLLSLMNFETLIATKASRVVQSARSAGVIEFGSRRAHGPEAGVLAARAAYIGGCIGTSNVLAGYLYGIPIYGTMAHSFIMNYDSEMEAFEKFCKVFPTSRALLLDTYDTIEAAKKAASSSLRPTLVRLDSGDRYYLSKKVRSILDRAGLKDTKIFVTGDLNEHALKRLTSRGAPIDFFGVGTELATSRDDPALAGIYKLVGITRAGKAIERVKKSEGKRTIPGAKQIHRSFTKARKIQRDILALENEDPPSDTVPLMVKVMEGGRITYTAPTLEAVREHAKSEISTLPPKFLSLKGSVSPPVKLSRKLELLANELWQSRT